MTDSTTNEVSGPLLQLNNLRVGFETRRGLAWAVDGVSLSAEVGRTLGLVGESGSGKSVTAKAIMRLLAPQGVHIQGEICFDGTDLLRVSDSEMRRRRGRDIAMVSQDPLRSLNPTIKVGSQIVEAIRLHEVMDRKAARRRAVELLDAVRIPAASKRVDDYPHQLSGGMRQRVMIAMALSCHPRLLIADEPTTALDVTTQAGILDLLGNLQHEHRMAIILVTHDLAVVASTADEVAVMYAGRIVEQAGTKELFRGMRMPYSKALLDSIPAEGLPAHSLLQTIPGRPPDPLHRPPGCAFHPRCPYRQDRCDEEPPELTGQVGMHRWACWHPLEVGAADMEAVRG